MGCGLQCGLYHSEPQSMSERRTTIGCKSMASPSTRGSIILPITCTMLGQFPSTRVSIILPITYTILGQFLGLIVSRVTVKTAVQCIVTVCADRGRKTTRMISVHVLLGSNRTTGIGSSVDTTAPTFGTKLRRNARRPKTRARSTCFRFWGLGFRV